MAMAMATAGLGRTASDGAYLSDPTTWAHQGHRLWASMSEAFWVYVYKVQRCPQPSRHDWTSCPYAHKGERARRRDPRRFSYLAVACPDYRASQQQQLLGGTGAAPTCVRGLRCRYAHGVFELWLHPGRFRTRMCEDGTRCPRRICFFAHCPAEVRSEDDVVPPVGLPPPPPRVPPVATSVCFPRQVDLILQAMPRKLSLYDAGASSPAAVAVATSALALAMASPDDKDSVSKSGRCADEEDSVINDYPHFDLIMDMVMS
ncbi:zinc finger CCCH domain-containing protein 10-like [Phragmites australis]|uniref:zinc finger CCCH domain-containing protein 10-like n=1 Tax=Phragmites australis TaxID=29695 RepID=UPI002D795633|nr:zinc finger CCCH domain-containing protein 10-like [Phragmites australis]